MDADGATSFSVAADCGHGKRLGRSRTPTIVDSGGLFSDGEADALEIGDAELAIVAPLAPENDVGSSDPSYMPPSGGADTLVVIGTRPGVDANSYIFWWENAPDPTVPQGGGTTLDPVTPSGQYGDPPEVEVQVINEANKEQLDAEAKKLLEGIADLTLNIDMLPDSARIQFADGTTMGAIEFKKLWATLDFRLTDAPPQPGRAGGYDNTTRTTTFFLTNDSGIPTITGWANSDTNGLSFILLHEVVHSSPEGVKEDTAQLEAYRIQRPAGVSLTDHYARYYDSIEFEENEEFANVGALHLATALKIPPATGFYPTSGYQYGTPDDDPDPQP